MALKIGSEDKKKVTLAVVLLVVVVFLVLRAVFEIIGAGTSSTPAPTTVAQAPTVTRAQPETQPNTQAPQEHEAAIVPSTLSGSIAGLDPTLHPEWMAAAESLEYAGKGRNIFSMASAPVLIEKPKESPRPSVAENTAPPPPPPPPPIDLKFFGYEAHGGGNRKAFLLHGDDVFIASVGDIVDHRYKIVGIAPLSIQVEDIPYNNTQTLPLIQN
jgi:hypothetical protein